MADQDVEVVRNLQPPPDADIARMFTDDELAAELLERVGPFFHDDCEVVGKTPIDEVSGTGLAGLRAVWQEWLGPWASYRAETEELRDLGEGRVLVLTRDFGRRTQMAVEAAMSAAALWTVRDGKVARVVFYPMRAEALAALGLDD